MGYFRYVIIDTKTDDIVAGPFTKQAKATAELRKLIKSKMYERDTLFISEIPS